MVLLSKINMRVHQVLAIQAEVDILVDGSQHRGALLSLFALRADAVKVADEAL